VAALFTAALAGGDRSARTRAVRVGAARGSIRHGARGERGAARDEDRELPVHDPGLRADPTVDRARIASNVRDGLASADLPPGTRLRFFSPASMAIAGTPDSLRGEEGSESYWEHNVRSALMDGLGVRVLFPNVETVEFVRKFTRDDPKARWAVYRPDGDLRVATTRELDSLLTAYRKRH
jgi:hypothetical protein